MNPIRCFSFALWALVLIPLLTDPAAAQTCHWEVDGDDIYNLNSGNVGIGTDQPQATLDVNGNIELGAAGSSYSLSLDPAANNLNIRNVNAGKALNLDHNGSLRIRRDDGTTKTTQVYVTAAGWVGIGTSQPQTTLDVNGNIELGRAGSSFVLRLDSAADNLNIRNTNAGKSLNLDHNGQLRIRLHSGSSAADQVSVLASGNVGIGTTNPQEKLEVNGTVRAREIVVTQQNWPDFVFADGYPLATLEEVEARIREAGHLPGIPSAWEAAESGVGVGEMQAKLLRKIEELTLHLIALDKENRSLETRIRNLESSQHRPSLGQRLTDLLGD